MINFYNKKLAAFLFLISYFLFLISPAIAAEIPQNLREAIDQKSKELQEIHQKILQTEKELEATEGTGRTLQKEIKQVDQRLSQLNLGIRSSEINIEKLGLEIESLGYDIKDTRESMDAKKSGVAQILRLLQARDNENILTAFLRGNSLSESIQELENLRKINLTLASDVEELRELDKALSGKLETTSQKKKKVETEQNNLKNRKIIATNEKGDRQALFQKTKNQEKLYQEQISDLKKLQQAVSAEVEKIEAELRAKIDPSLLPIPRPGVLNWPVTPKEQGGLGRLTQKWGIPSRLYSAGAHNGIDIGAPLGTPVTAAEKGKVLEVWDQDRYCYKGAYGKFIVIEHENNLTTLYAHLSLQSVARGDTVERGQLIGYTGSTGYATGPHLHFTVYASQTFISRPSKVNCGPVMPFGGDLDPLRYL